MSNKIYAGESYPKKLARAVVYTQWIDSAVFRRGKVVTLTGDEAAEAGIFRTLGARAGDCWFVDRLEANGEQARRRLPGCVVASDDIVDVLGRMAGPLAFVHLDFMGPFKDETRAAMVAASTKVLVGGYVLWTFLRGRETDKSPWWRRAKEETRSRFSDEIATDFMTRLWGYMEIGLDVLNNQSHGTGAGFYPAGALNYDSGKSPMGMLLFRKRSRKAQTAQARLLGFYGTLPDEGPERRRYLEAQEALIPLRQIRGDAKHYIRQAVCRSARASSELANVFNLEEGTVRAWRAHATRGTYATAAPSPDIVAPMKELFSPCPCCAGGSELAKAQGVRWRPAPEGLADKAMIDREKFLASEPSKYTRRGMALRRLKSRAQW